MKHSKSATFYNDLIASDEKPGFFGENEISETGRD